MRCLYITPFNPYPPQSGGAILADLMLREIGKRGKVDVATFGDSTDYSPYGGVDRVIRFRKDPLYRVRAFSGEFPESMERYFDGELNRLVRAGGYSHVFCDSFAPALNLLRPRKALGRDIPFRTVLLCHNLESRVERENLQFDPGHYSWCKQKIATRDAERMEKAEETLLPLFDRILSVSEHESRIMEDRYGCRGSVLTLPVSFPGKPAPGTEERREDTLLFAGSMWWLPNRHGLAWFFENCWGSILAVRPGARVVLAGNDKTGIARRMAQRYPNVTATGFVEDIEPFFREASVFILPMLIGTGIKIKLLEAMGWGLPVVSTPKGVEGIPGFEPGRHALVCGDPETFAKGVVRLLEDPLLRKAVVRTGLELAESNRGKLESMLDEVFCGD